jgi:hypothetical protein
MTRQEIGEHVIMPVLTERIDGRASYDLKQPSRGCSR